MIVTQFTKDALAMFRYARELRDDPSASFKMEHRFGRDSVNWVATVFHYARRRAS